MYASTKLIMTVAKPKCLRTSVMDLQSILSKDFSFDSVEFDNDVRTWMS